MGIEHKTGIEDKTNTPKVRDQGDTLAVAQQHIAEISNQFKAEQAAAIELLNSQRNATGEVTYAAGTSYIAGASQKARGVLADLFAPTKSKEHTIA